MTLLLLVLAAAALRFRTRPAAQGTMIRFMCKRASVMGVSVNKRLTLIGKGADVCGC